jgi:hypothetical protein
MLSVLIVLVAVGVLLYCINKYAPMDQKIKSILNIVVIACVVIWLLNLFGIFHAIDKPVPQFHK